jgi:large subunit ribosomal protein L6
MSKIGRKPIQIPEGVRVEIKPDVIEVTGPSGVLQVPMNRGIKVEEDSGVIKVSRKSDDKLSKSLHGLTRALIANAITGVKDGYEKQLEIIGVGYRAAVEGSDLQLKVGFSHDVEIKAPEGIAFEVKKNIISVKGNDKQLVGQMAAKIREVRKPEPYKGKGIKYVGEKILRKVGKAVKGATGA